MVRQYRFSNVRRLQERQELNFRPNMLNGWHCVVLSILAASLTGACERQSSYLTPTRKVVLIRGKPPVIEVQGIGIIEGLKGTGDGPTFTPLVQLAKRLHSDRGMVANDYKSMAIVVVSSQLPVPALKGMISDVTVHALGPAVSLNGGYLTRTELVTAIDSTLSVLAEGRVETCNCDLSTSGKVAKSAIVITGSTSLMPATCDKESPPR